MPATAPSERRSGAATPAWRSGSAATAPGSVAAKASTTSASHCVPRPRISSPRATSWSSAVRYGRFDVIASHASATAMIRAPSGICAPARIAAPAHALVVREHELAPAPVLGELGEDVRAVLRVLLHQLELLVGQ